MCGIAGIIDFSDCRPDEGLLRRMLGLIRHRGPDAFGIYLDNTVGLASTRLSILDLAGGDQPIHNEDRSIWIAYNGEVFNYVELRENLEKRGHTFYTHTDTEVLVHLFEEKGPEMLQDLNGQFGLALWDRRTETAFLARDRMGIRPLFYRLGNKRLVFASEIKAIFADPTIQRTLNPMTLSDIFTCWSPMNDLTPFDGVNQLKPGDYAIFSTKGLKTKQYWQLPFGRSEKVSKPIEDCKDELKDLLYDACKIRLRADVPVGAYLSGGLDSTCITSLVKNYFNNTLCTFSVNFADSRFDESPFQKRAVESLNTDHRMILCTDRDIGEAFPNVIWHAEAPLLRTAPVPMFQLSKLVRNHNFKVVLTGEGADEIFAGYDIFKEDHIRRFWARQPNSTMRPKLFQKLYPDIFQQQDSRARPFLEGFFGKGLSLLDSPGYSHMIRWDNTAHLKGFFTAEMQQEIANLEPFFDRFVTSLPRDFMNWDPLSRAQYIESTIFLSHYLLCSQGDRMSMAHAVEGRFPFLDHRVVEFATRVPPIYRLHYLKDKYILREASKDWIPSDLANRPKKPYRAPISRCFFGETPLSYVEDLLSEQSLRKKGYFHPGKVLMLVDKIHRHEGRLLSERENMAIVGIISTQLLHDQFVDRFPWSTIQEPEVVKIFDYRHS